MTSRCHELHKESRKAAVGTKGVAHLEGGACEVCGQAAGRWVQRQDPLVIRLVATTTEWAPVTRVPL
jgi:hypothetical protein